MFRSMKQHPAAVLPRAARPRGSMRRYFRLAVVAAVVGCGLTARPAAAQNTVVDFNPATPGLSGPPASVTANSVSPGLGTPISLTRGAGVGSNSATGRFNGNGVNSTTLAAAITANDYFSWTVNPTTGYALDLSGL